MPAWNLISGEDKLRHRRLHQDLLRRLGRRRRRAPPVPIKPDPVAQEAGEGHRRGRAGLSRHRRLLELPPRATPPKPTIAEDMKSATSRSPASATTCTSRSRRRATGARPSSRPTSSSTRTKIAATAEELVRVIAAGRRRHGDALVGRRASPTEQLWGLAYYVESLVQKRGTPEGRRSGRASPSSRRSTAAGCGPSPPLRMSPPRRPRPRRGRLRRPRPRRRRPGEADPAQPRPDAKK